MAKNEQTVARTETLVKVNVVGTELEVNVSAFSPAVMEYVVAYGLRQMLNDCHASITAKVEPDDAKRAAQKVGAAQKKLDSLMAGNVAQARAAGGGSADPVVAEMRRMAESRVKQAIKASGKKVGDYAKTLSGMVDRLVERDEAELRPVAERVVAERKSAPAIELPDLDDLIG